MFHKVEINKDNRFNKCGCLIRCVAAKGEDAPECDKFAKYYRSLCPGEWVCIYCFHHYGLHTALVACCGVEIRKKYFEACGLCILS
jgi:hypothetical protein